MPESHEGLPVAGYQPQSSDNIQRVNTNKVIEEEVLRQIDAYQSMVGYDKRWLSIARTHIEQGFMALNRAIFQPKRVSLPSDAEQAKP